jgi:hypothetical protein
VKYAYQELPHSENTASPRNEKEERVREHVYIRILISKGHHKRLKKKRTLGDTAYIIVLKNSHFVFCRYTVESINFILKARFLHT